MAGNNNTQDLGQLLKVRREKLADLQNAGKDPFQITTTRPIILQM